MDKKHRMLKDLSLPMHCLLTLRHKMYHIRGIKYIRKKMHRLNQTRRRALILKLNLGRKGIGLGSSMEQTMLLKLQF